MTFPERAKAIQTDSDIKVRALAKALDVHEYNLGSYLNGKRTMPYDVMISFAKYYHVTTDYLLGLTDDPAPPYPVSPSERTMLESFRSLSREQRELIVQNIEFMRRQNQQYISGT